MATTTNANRTNRTSKATPDVEAATERMREANDRIVGASRKVTLAYLDGVERYWTGVAKAERRLADRAQVEGFGQLITAHADLTEDVIKASVSATRDLVVA